MFLQEALRERSYTHNVGEWNGDNTLSSHFSTTTVTRTANEDDEAKQVALLCSKHLFRVAVAALMLVMYTST